MGKGSKRVQISRDIIQMVICALKNLFDRLTVLKLMLSANGAKTILIPF